MAGEQAPNPDKARIAQLNDAFRQAGPTHDWFITRGVQGLPDVPELIQRVQTYDRFSSENDPFGEHDYGSFAYRGERTLWKIDYYDAQLQYWQNPLSEECRRVMTIMLSSEY